MVPEPAALATRSQPAPTAARLAHADEYDRLHRLVGATTTENGATVRDTDYAYDPAANRASRTRGGQTTSYAYDRADRVTNVGGTAYTVDPNGNLTQRGPDTFGYDQPNRLTSATVGSTTASYGYTGARPAADAAARGIRLEVVRHTEAKRGFVLLPRCWVVERRVGWMARFRRPALCRLRLPDAPSSAPRRHRECLTGPGQLAGHRP